MLFLLWVPFHEYLVCAVIKCMYSTRFLHQSQKFFNKNPHFLTEVIVVIAPKSIQTQKMQKPGQVLSEDKVVYPGCHRRWKVAVHDDNKTTSVAGWFEASPERSTLKSPYLPYHFTSLWQQVYIYIDLLSANWPPYDYRIILYSSSSAVSVMSHNLAFDKKYIPYKSSHVTIWPWYTISFMRNVRENPYLKARPFHVYRVITAFWNACVWFDRNM